MSLFRRRDRRRIYYVLDVLGWVQEARVKVLQELLSHFEFKILTQKQFVRAWRMWRLRGQPVYFASWRMLGRLWETEAIRIDDGDFNRFMTSVTSHYNIGGGLAPEMAISAGADPQQVYAAAIAVLKRCRVTTANSRILYDMLQADVPSLIYAPNGVDAKFYRPTERLDYDPGAVRIGWVGRVKGAKNVELRDEAERVLTDRGFELSIIAQNKTATADDVLSSKAMLEFYRNIDYYLCTSWHEGTPNPALEAAACGVPLITTRVGNMPDLIEERRNGYFIDPDLDSILQVCEEARRLSKEEYAKMRCRARAAIEAEWTWERQITNYRTAFDRLFED